MKINVAKIKHGKIYHSLVISNFKEIKGMVDVNEQNNIQTKYINIKNEI
tara:strand:+ start:466 stop:612 length:147 start_codon:yes stop_codon:yes gene_type:complete